MSPKQLSQAWYKWKALRLPWRKRFLIGLDLQGNTFWEFKDVRGTTDPGRWRRIVQYAGQVQHSDVKVSPLWHQWLRHTREKPPSLQEQRQDVVRQEQMKYLAAEADARWAAKPSYIDAPGQARGQPLPALRTEPPNLARSLPDGEKPTQNDPIASVEDVPRTETGPVKEDPWKKHRGGPSEDWQPTGWTPSVPPKR